MPTLYNVEAEVDIDPIEFLESCKYLIKNKYITDDSYEESKRGIWEHDFIENLNRLKNNYHSMSNEDIENITILCNKYGI